MKTLHSDSIKTRWLRNWDDVAEIEDAWVELVARTPCASIFQTYQWHASWWGTFGKDYELRLLVCYNDRQIIGIAPLMLSTATGYLGVRRRQLLFIGSSNNASDYLDFIIDSKAPMALNALLQEVADRRDDFDRAYLSNIPTHWDNYARIVKILDELGVAAEVQPHQSAPCRMLGNSAEDRKIANKTSLRRHYNYFRKAGELRFKRCETESAILQYIDVFFEHHVSRWAETDSPSLFLDPENRSFYRDLVTRLIPTEWLKFDVVLFNEEPIAFHFGFEYDKKFIWYKPTYNIAYSKRSPGGVLIKFLLESAIERDLDEFDFTVGNESFKHRFANTVRQNNRITIFHSSLDQNIYKTGRKLHRIRTHLRNRLSGSASRQKEV